MEKTTKKFSYLNTEGSRWNMAQARSKGDFFQAILIWLSFPITIGVAYIVTDGSFNVITCDGLVFISSLLILVATFIFIILLPEITMFIADYEKATQRFKFTTPDSIMKTTDMASVRAQDLIEDIVKTLIVSRVESLLENQNIPYRKELHGISERVHRKLGPVQDLDYIVVERFVLYEYDIVLEIVIHRSSLNWRFLNPTYKNERSDLLHHCDISLLRICKNRTFSEQLTDDIDEIFLPLDPRNNSGDSL